MSARIRFDGWESTHSKSTGDLVLWWEVARVRRLGRLLSISVVAAQKAHTTPSWRTVSGLGRLRQSQRPIFLTLPKFSPLQRLSSFLLRKTLHAGAAQPAKNRSA